MLARAGVTANQVTVAAGVLSVATGVVLALAERPALLLALPLVLFVRMALNAVDGMLAREFGQKSALGAFLNELSDVVSDAALALPFAFLPHFGGLGVAVFAVLAAVSEMAGVLGPTVGASRRYDGPLGKSDRAFVLGALGLAVGLGVAPSPWLRIVFPALGLLLVATTLNRVRSALGKAGQA